MKMEAESLMMWSGNVHCEEAESNYFWFHRSHMVFIAYSPSSSSFLSTFLTLQAVQAVVDLTLWLTLPLNQPDNHPPLELLLRNMVEKANWF